MSDTKWYIIEIFALIGICILMVIGINSCSATDWNDGICPNCEVRYELRGHSQGISACACPKCGKEVHRY